MKVIIIGNGIVGASAAYHLAKNNIEVVVIDNEHQGHATAAGAGIICPWRSRDRGEAWYNIASAGARFYPTLIEELESDGEHDMSYKKVGALVTSSDTQKLGEIEADLTKKQKYAPEMGEVRRLTNEQAHEYFPSLHNELEAVLIPGAARVDGNLIRHAMMRAAKKHGATKISGEATLLSEDDKVVGVSVNEEMIKGDVVLITAGAWAPKLLSPFGVNLHVEPQRGQIAHLKLLGTNTSEWPVVLPDESSHYMLAFDDSRVVVGATRETGSGFDYRMTAGGMYEVISEGLSVAPGLADATLDEVRIGFRPAGPDFLPLLGPIDSLSGVFLANGLGPSGLTVGPYVGKLAALMMTDQQLPIDISPYDPNRALK